MEMDWVTGSILFGHSEADRHQLTIKCNIHSIFPSSWFDKFLPRFPWSTQFVLFLLAWTPVISSHPLPTILMPNLYIIAISIWMQPEVQQCVYNRLSALELCCFATPARECTQVQSLLERRCSWQAVDISLRFVEEYLNRCIIFVIFKLPPLVHLWEWVEI